jgi:uncharacterized protein (DUF1697 family)
VLVIAATLPQRQDGGMPTFIALLRAVNVGKRQVKMASLREWLVEDGFTDVETYIQTGNVKLGTRMRSPQRVEERLERLLLERAGFEVPCIMLTPEELRRVYDDALGLEAPPVADGVRTRRYVVLFKDPVEARVIADMAAYDPPGERVWAVGRAAHIWVTTGMQDAKVFGAFAKALAAGTNRNLEVMAAMAERWGAGEAGEAG